MDRIPLRSPSLREPCATVYHVAGKHHQVRQAFRVWAAVAYGEGAHARSKRRHNISQIKYQFVVTRFICPNRATSEKSRFRCRIWQSAVLGRIADVQRDGTDSTPNWPVGARPPMLPSSSLPAHCSQYYHISHYRVFGMLVIKAGGERVWRRWPSVLLGIRRRLCPVDW